MIRLKSSAILLALAMTGCAAQEHLPKYNWSDAQTAVRDLAARAHAVRSLSAEATVTLTKPTGDSVRLDAAVAMQPPERLRLRAWKFNQSVFDLTLNPDGVYLITPADASLREKIHSGGVSAAQLGRTWSVLTSTFFDSPDLEVVETSTRLLITSHLDQQKVICDIDRATLTPRRYTLYDADNRARFTLALSRYVDHAGILYPDNLLATSDSGKIEISLRNIELNSSLAPEAFKPPRRAEKLP